MEDKYFARLSLLTAFLIAILTLIDPIVAYDGLSWHYPIVRSFFVISFLVLYIFNRKKKISSLAYYDLYGYLLYLLPFYGMVYIGPIYTFCFMHCFIAVAITTQTTIKRFSLLSIVGLILCVLGHYLTQEPKILVEGISIRPYLFLAAVLFQFISSLIYIFVTRYRLQINKLTQKYALIGKKSSFLIHEIRTPLTRVYSQTHQNESHELLNSINGEANRILSLIDSVEALIYRPLQLKKTFILFSLEDIKEELHREFSSYLKAINIDFKFEHENIEIFGNRNLIYQLLKNIVVNAIEAIGYQEQEKPSIHISSKRMNDKTIISIRNTHSTIPKNSIKKVFEPNFSTKSQPSNKGLGLTLAKSIIEAHKGEIKVFSLDNFTEFEIALNSQLVEV